MQAHKKKAYTVIGICQCPVVSKKKFILFVRLEFGRTGSECYSL